MKKLLLCFMILTLAGCGQMKYLPEVRNDKTYTSIGARDYTIDVPDGYHYEKEMDNGAFVEKWEYKKRDDVEIKVSTYNNTDEATARGRFLRVNDDYIFEDLMGYPACGMELDGDTLWFNLYQSSGTVYIVSWEYPKNISDELKLELSRVAGTFKCAE